MNRISTLVVVADGGTARFFTWPQKGAYLTEHESLRMEVPPAEPEQGPSPRVHDSTGHHRHRVERRLSAHEANEEKFLENAAKQIRTVMTRLSAASLILCAPPKALGSLRAALARDGGDFELATMDKDLTKETVTELERRLGDLRMA